MSDLSAHPLVDNSSEFRMGMVLRKAHAGVFVRDLVNKTVTWSPELRDLLGIAPEVPSQSVIFMDMIHPDDRARVERDTQALIQQGGSYYQEFRVIRRDGETIWLSSTSYVEQDASGQPLTLTGINQDITARKAAEQAREQAHAEAVQEKNRLLAMMEAIPIGVAILDLQAKVIQANRGYEAIWGGPPPTTTCIDDFSAYKAWWIKSQEPVQAEEWAAARAIQKGETVINQFMEIERFEGSHRFVLNSAAPIWDEQDRRQGCVVAIQDITTQHRLEQETLEAIKQVEQQRKIIENREKERQEIAREIHDGPIQTLVSMMFDIQLSRGLFEESGVKEEALEELDKIKNHLKGAVQELRDVVNNLRPPALLRFGLGKTLKVYIEDFREKHPDLKLELLFDLPDDQIYFSEDANLSIYRLCQEGLSNILRHARATKASIRFTREENRVILEINDNGRGFEVPKDLAHKIQEGHYGLAGMNERVGALGGDLLISSSPLSGTTVRVSIPLEQQTG